MMNQQTVHVVHIVVQFVHTILVYLLDDVRLLLFGKTEVIYSTAFLE